MSLRPGARARVTFPLSSRALSYWDARHDRWVVAPGCYRIMLGSSSRDIAARARLALRGGRCTG